MAQFAQERILSHQRPSPDHPHFAAPPDGSRGSRSAPGSRRLSHISQITVFSLPCLGVYHWLRTQVTLTPATFRLPHPRPSARLGSEAGEPTGAREHVCGPDVILTAGVKGAREGARVKIMSVGACKLRVGRAGRRRPLYSLRTPPTSGLDVRAARRKGPETRIPND